MLSNAASMIAPPWEAVSTCSGSPSATIAEGTPSWAEATSPAARGWREMPRGEQVHEHVQRRQRPSKLDQRRVGEQPAQIRAEPQARQRTAGMKKPPAMPSTSLESRFGPPTAATISPAPKPAIKRLAPLR